MRRPLAAALLAATLFATAPLEARGEANGLLDYDIPNGHFYTQANGHPLGRSPLGFSITDDFGVRFWSEFQRLGGVDRLGYPMSRRFDWHGWTVQIVQKAVLQWAPDIGMVQVVNLFDLLHDLGKEDWLQREWLVPAREPAAPYHALDGEGAVDWLAAQGEAGAAFASFFRAAPDPLALYGLPTSAVRDHGELVAVRFQKGTLQLWRANAPGTAVGKVTGLNAGELLARSDILPPEVLVPEEAMAVEEVEQVQRQGTSRSQPTIFGLATWYGKDFQGSVMRNGERYDMHDATIAAANAFPLGSWIVVTNTDTGASVEVRVTDTGAFRYPNVADLSYAAFRKLAHPDRGVINVAVQLRHRD